MDTDNYETNDQQSPLYYPSSMRGTSDLKSIWKTPLQIFSGKFVFYNFYLGICSYTCKASVQMQRILFDKNQSFVSA